MHSVSHPVCVWCMCVCVCHCVPPHVREKVSAREMEHLQRAQKEKREQRIKELEEEQKNRETLAPIEGCNLIY